MNFIRMGFGSLAVLVVITVFPLISFAQNVLPPSQDTSGKIVNPIEAETLNGLIKTLLKGVLRIGIPLIALAIIYSGFLFVFARGNSEKLTKARTSLMYTLIGAAILLGSWAIAELISETVRTL